MVGVELGNLDGGVPVSIEVIQSIALDVLAVVGLYQLEPQDYLRLLFDCKFVHPIIILSSSISSNRSLVFVLCFEEVVIDFLS